MGKSRQKEAGEVTELFLHTLLEPKEEDHHPSLTVAQSPSEMASL